MSLVLEKNLKVWLGGEESREKLKMGSQGVQDASQSLCPLLNVAQNPRVLPLLSLLGWSNSDPQPHRQPLLPPVLSSILQETGTGPAKPTAWQCHVPSCVTPPKPPMDPSKSTPSLPWEPEWL